MAIVIDRKTGEILAAHELTSEQKQKAWESIVKTYAERHPEKLQELIETKEKNEGPI